MTHNLLKVLFVEDSEDDALLLLEALHTEYPNIFHDRVDSARTLGEALAREKWDVIICDHNLPDLDATSALRICQERCEDIPFIIVSGLISEELAASVMMNGASDTISKARIARLVPAIRRELHNKSAIHQLSDAREKINRIAYRDQLTGLPNREFLAMQVNALLNGAAPPPNLVVLAINISRFLQIQGALGIEAANITLQMIAERIQNCIGDSGLTARLGGDRFAVMLPGNLNNGAIIEKIRAIKQNSVQPLMISGHELFLNCNIGISVYPRDGRDFHELFVNAETAMRTARTEKRCNYLFFDSSMNSVDKEHLMLEHGLHRAIQEEEFLLHYQPQFDLRSGKLVGVEALLRWNSPAGLIPPAKFIPLLEETRLILPVGEWVMRKACEQNKAWQDAGLLPVPVAVNLSAIQFQQTDLIPMVRRILNETGLPARFLELEITENIAMHNEELIIATLTELRAIGVNLAIDDFGTGYSSLSYLNRFPVQKLKIDRAFVKDITDVKQECSIAKAIISLAHNLNLGIIAEGVETDIQASVLRESGCEEVQGFLYSPPMSPEKVEIFLANGAFDAENFGALIA